MKALFLSILFMVATITTHAQGRTDWWGFGNQSRIHFTGSGVDAFNLGINSLEGCAAISDENGNALLYTNGTSLRNGLGSLVNTGSAMLGQQHASQSSVIVPHPGDDDLYIVFTVPSAGNGRLRYTTIDVTANSGQGGVYNSELNVALHSDSVAEKITGIHKGNGVDYWVISHALGNNQFHVYSVTSSGVNSVPTVVSEGPVHATNSAEGYMKLSPDGTRLVVARTANDSIDVFQFDPMTGGIFYDYSLPFLKDNKGPYGVGFSQDGTFLYASNNGRFVMQYDLLFNASQDVLGSEALISDTSTNDILGGIQLAPNQQVYIARKYSLQLPSIRYPWLPGAQAQFEPNSVSLVEMSIHGLPNFIQSFFAPLITVDVACAGATTQFGLQYTGMDSVRWDFGDPGSGNQNTSTLVAPTHLYANTGTYLVSLISYDDTLTDTVYQRIRVHSGSLLSLTLTGDSLLCPGASNVLTAGGNGTGTLLWSTGEADSTITVSNPGAYSVTRSNECGSWSDTIHVVSATKPEVTLPFDTLLCDGDTLYLHGQVDEVHSSVWNTGATDDTLEVWQEGTFWTIASNTCGSDTDSIVITTANLPDVNLLPADTLLCFDQVYSIKRPDDPGIEYTWSDSSSKETYSVDTTSMLWLAAENECGMITDTLSIIYNGEIFSELGEDTNICEGDSILLIATHPGASYVWNTGDTTDTVWTDQLESFNYVVTVTYKACQTIESKRVDMDDFFCEPIDCVLEYPNTFSPNGDGINDIFRPWSDCEIYSYTLTVYNRWGLLVHHDTHEAFGWDGNIHGQPAPEGVYYFLIDFLDQVVVDEDRNIYQGSMTIVR